MTFSEALTYLKRGYPIYTKVDGVILRMTTDGEGVFCKMGEVEKEVGVAYVESQQGSRLEGYPWQVDKSKEIVHHPVHYQDETGIECIEIADKFSFCGGNCIKYLFRAGKKDEFLVDIEKALWYAKRQQINLYGIPKEQLIPDKETRQLLSRVAESRVTIVRNCLNAICGGDWKAVVTSLTRYIKQATSAQS